jgi:hypothetical protein
VHARSADVRHLRSRYVRLLRRHVGLPNRIGSHSLVEGLGIVKGNVWWLVVAVTLLASVASCGGSGYAVPFCTGVSWLNRPMPAEMTGAPSFTASQVAPGDPIALAIPVSEYAQSVSARIRFAGPPAGSIATLAAETVGNETVHLALENTDLSPGVYFADFIQVAGADSPAGTSYWDSGGVALPYILNVVTGGDGGPSCESDIPIPTFEVVGD